MDVHIGSVTSSCRFNEAPAKSGGESGYQFSTSKYWSRFNEAPAKSGGEWYISVVMIPNSMLQ